MALGAYQHLEERGLRIPEDVGSIAGLLRRHHLPAGPEPRITTIESRPGCARRERRPDALLAHRGKAISPATAGLPAHAQGQGQRHSPRPGKAGRGRRVPRAREEARGAEITDGRARRAHRPLSTAREHEGDPESVSPCWGSSSCSPALPFFFDLDNLINVLRQVCSSGIIALGMTLVIVCGEIDLSVGSLYGASAIFTGVLLVDKVPMALAVPPARARRRCALRAPQWASDHLCAHPRADRDPGDDERGEGAGAYRESGGPS